jgi:siroheme synthase (precorrin-2 oxidase/ferrochelatase)
MISFPPSKESFISSNGKQPKISLAVQERIRETCMLAGIDAVKVVGLPELTEAPLLKKILAKGSNREIQKVKREQKIKENMAGMDKRIQQYKLERQKAKLAKKPELPF